MIPKLGWTLAGCRYVPDTSVMPHSLIDAFDEPAAVCRLYRDPVDPSVADIEWKLRLSAVCDRLWKLSQRPSDHADMNLCAAPLSSSACYRLPMVQPPDLPTPYRDISLAQDKIYSFVSFHNDCSGRRLLAARGRVKIHQCCGTC